MDMCPLDEVTVNRTRSLPPTGARGIPSFIPEQQGELPANWKRVSEVEELKGGRQMLLLYAGHIERCVRLGRSEGRRFLNPTYIV